MKLSHEEYAALLRSDFACFVERCFIELNSGTSYFGNWHIDLICERLVSSFQGKARRHLICVAPRSLKSLICSVAFPAWVLGHCPTAHIICVSYSQDLADYLAMQCRRVMMSDWYKALFPTRLVGGRPSLADFHTIQGGGRFATSIGGTLTGRGADFIIIDDPMKPMDALSKSQREATNAWYDHTLQSRLNNKITGRIIVIMQRLHVDDLAGHVLEKGDWSYLRLPAIAEQEESFAIQTPFEEIQVTRLPGDLLHPEREPWSVLQDMRDAIGEYHFAAQYQQSPVSLEGNLIKENWFQFFESHELPVKFDQIVQSWDTASKDSDFSDYSVCTTWGRLGKKMYLLDVFRAKLDFPALRRKVPELASQHRADNVLIEDKASGIALIQELRNAGMSNISAIKPEGDKLTRMHGQTAQIEGGFVLFPKEAPWLDAYLIELLSFPKGKHDDQVDSTSQALRWLQMEGQVPALLQFYREQALQGRNKY